MLLKVQSDDFSFLQMIEHAGVPAQSREIKGTDYIDLHIMVKGFYDTSVKAVSEAKNRIPEYPK